MWPLGKQIEVTVEAHGLAERFVSPGTYRLREGSSLEALLRKAARQASLPPLTFMIGGQRIERDRRLVDGETVRVFQMAAGG